MIKQCVPLTLDDTSLSDVRKTCSCGDPHIANIVVPAIDHNQTLILVAEWRRKQVMDGGEGAEFCLT